MKTIFEVLSWISGIFFLLLSILSIMAGHFLPSLFVLLIVLLLIPPLRRRLAGVSGISFPVWMRGMLIPVFFFLFVFLIFRGMGNPDSIYRTPEVQKKLMRIYDERLSRWPVPYESRYLNTPFGKVHIIISGPETGSPVLLLHASAMASWSWLYNIRGLNGYYRTYAIDTIGDAGKSMLADIRHFPNDGRALATFYAEIMDSLGINSATLIGASQGGFIATNIALYRSERVNKIILCGPMGYTGTNASVLRILFTTMFPLKAIQTSATHWAFGDDPRINREVGEWFTLILEGVISRQARPVPFAKEQLQSLKMPVLLLLGKRDGLVGDPGDARQLAQNIPNAEVRTLDTGHLISAERPQAFNKLVVDFINR